MSIVVLGVRSVEAGVLPVIVLCGLAVGPWVPEAMEAQTGEGTGPRPPSCLTPIPVLWLCQSLLPGDTLLGDPASISPQRAPAPEAMWQGLRHWDRAE